MRLTNVNVKTRCKSHVEEPFSCGSMEQAQGDVERAQWGHRGGCYPLSPLRLREENDEAKVPKVDDLMQLNWHFRTEREESPRESKLLQLTISN